MHASISENSRRVSGGVQSISVLVTVAMVCLSLRPLAAAAQPSRQERSPAAATLAGQKAPESPTSNADVQYAQALGRLENLANSGRVYSAQQRLEAVREGLRHLEELEPAVAESFDSVGRMLDEKHLSSELKRRHQAAVLDFKQKQAKLKRIIEKFKAADAANHHSRRTRSLKELGAFLAANHKGKRHKKLNPNKLPWRVQDSKVRQPATSQKAFPRWVETSSTGGPESLSVERTALASLASSSAAELAETDEVQLTQPVRDLAVSLGSEPVRIYNWVRNNIEYIPSFGSIQGSDATLSKKRGNAFDTAALLIALFRASDIPARYVYGTIQVPVEAAMSWVGGVSTPEAAQQLWSQGGVPNSALVSGGRITHIQIEHVWVEAWVDFVPSRGQKHVQGDTWVPLDASFKQYTDNVGLLSEANVKVDASSFQSSFLSGAVLNEAEGWAQSLNLGSATLSAEQYVSAVNDYIQARNPGASKREVYGTRIITKDESEVLAASLPYKMVAVGARYADMPSALTHKFRYMLYSSSLDRSLGNPLLSFSEGLPMLAGRKMTLLYLPATQADADLIASFLPQMGPDGGSPTMEQVAAISLPAYLIKLKPELRVDGVVRASGEPVFMGSELSATGAFTALGLSSGWDETTDILTAGQVTAIGLNTHGIDKRQFLRLKTRMEETQARLEVGDQSQVTGDVIGGDLLTMSLWNYFATVDEGGRAMIATTRMIDIPALSYGLAHVDMDVQYSFGIAKRAKPAGIMLDIGHLRNIRWSKDNDKEVWVLANRIMGQHSSAMEHQILESLFVSQQMPGEAVSSVKLIAKAASDGQRIFVITRSNASVALPQLGLSAETLVEIQSAIAAGKKVTVHQQPVVVNGWSGAGYIVTDEETGAGAYMIEGGANGGRLLHAYNSGAMVGLVLAACIVFLAWGLPAIGPLGFLFSVVLIAAMLLPIIAAIQAGSTEEEWHCFAGSFTLFLGLGLTAVPGVSQAFGVVLDLFTGMFIDGSSMLSCID